jgi:peroxiredoxin
MKRFVLIVLLALASVRTPSLGEAAPDFRLADQDGKAVSLSAARGGKVVLVFYRGYW